MQVPDCNIAILLLIFRHLFPSAVQKFPWRFQNSVSVYMYTKTHRDVTFIRIGFFHRGDLGPRQYRCMGSSRSLKLQRKSSQPNSLTKRQYVSNVHLFICFYLPLYKASEPSNNCNLTSLERPQLRPRFLLLAFSQLPRSCHVQL